jgi:lipopolysaccharide export system permease protein
MVDMVLNIDEFMKGGDDNGAVSGWQLGAHIARYYFFRCFEYFQLLCGAAMLVGGAFAVARLNKHNELVAFKASGVSVYRLLRPVIVSAVGVSALYIANQELIIPNIIDELASKRSIMDVASGFDVRYVRDTGNALFSAPVYLPQEQSMVARIDYAPGGTTIVYREPVRIVERDPRTDETLAIIDADRAVYDAQQGGWQLTNALRWEVDTTDLDSPEAESIREEAKPVRFFRTDMNPQMLLRHEGRAYFRYLSFGRLRDLLRETVLLNSSEYEVVMHQHFSKPILNLIILLLGLPFVVGQEGKSYFISIVVCIGLFVLVLATEYGAAEFAKAGHIPPILGAYLPVLIFTPVAVVSLDVVRT